MRQTVRHLAFQGNDVAIGKMAMFTSQGDRIKITPFDTSNIPAVAAAVSKVRLNA